ncbi:APSES transcription factor Xbp1 protein [Rutstroemia sp. NJR-2017a BBW]|nr:APSES transcription factor Xbp1 protein [Rutstroemia sp. NJR-2017a BBW]
MASIASLLNPVNSVRRVRLPSSSTPFPSLCTPPSSYGNISPQFPPSTKKLKMTKNGVVSAKGKIQGDITYPPFDHLDERTKREVETFGVDLMNGIQTKNIPYSNKTNDPRKDFFSKTGRESFEDTSSSTPTSTSYRSLDLTDPFPILAVFTYEFKVPDHDDNKTWTVMWDYEIGLVRITPFFKCFKYPKTMPGRMLDLNPGLKDISHSITGGALTAQGYWMPFECARALCATFCHKIAYALVPMFGPDFPSQCSSPGAPEHCLMKIDPSITITATVQAEKYRLKYMRRALISSTSSLPSAPASLPTSAPTPTLASSSTSAFASTPTSAASSPQNRRINLKRHVSESSFADDVEAWNRAATADAGPDVDGGMNLNHLLHHRLPMTTNNSIRLGEIAHNRTGARLPLLIVIIAMIMSDKSSTRRGIRSPMCGTPLLRFKDLAKESLGGLGITVANPVLSSIPRSVPHFSTPEEWIGMVKRSVEVMDEKFGLEESLGFTTDEKIPGEDVALWKSMHALASRQKDMVQAVSPPQEEHEVVLHEPGSETRIGIVLTGCFPRY